MTIHELINNQLNDVKLNLSQGTFKHYDSHLSHFKKWCDSNSIINVEDLTNEKIIDYINDLKETCQNITINKRIGILKRSFKNSNIPFVFLQSIKKFKETRTTFDMVEYDTLKMIRKYVLSLDDKYITHKCATLLMMDTGARINEILSIETKDVNQKSRDILLRTTKTKEQRFVFISEKTVNVIRELLKITNNQKYLLINTNSKNKLNYFDINWYMKKLKKELSLEKLHPHMFRHSLATIWLENGADILTVMNVLGHKNMETTQRYLHASKTNIKKKYNDFFKLD